MVTLTATGTAPSTSVLTRTYVGLVADRVSVRRIQALLDRKAFDVVAVSGGGVDALLDRALVPLDVAVLVGDLSSLVRGGAVELLRNLRPNLPLVLVHRDDDRAAVRKALRAGVQGFVAYANLAAVLAPTIEAVLAGQLSVPQSIRTRTAWGTFSLREKQVLQLAAAGLTNAEIASRLFLSESTVKTHLSSSFRKLGVSSRAEAAAAVFDPDTGLQPRQATHQLVELEAALLGAAA